MVDMVILGIVDEYYHVECDMEGDRFAWCSNGLVNNQQVDSYDTGDEIFITLNFKELSLSYKIITKDDKELNGVLFGPKQIDREKYKWAVSTDDHLDCVEIIDIY